MKKIKGFTLTELIVGMLIFILIVTAATGILLASQGILIKQTENVQASKIGDSICQLIRQKLTHAQNMNITEDLLLSDDDDIYTEILYFQNGRVYFSYRASNSESFSIDTLTQDLFGDEFYNGLLVKVEVKNPAENLIDVTVELFEQTDEGIADAPCYHNDFNLLLTNMAEFNKGTLTANKGHLYTSEAEGPYGFYIYLN